MTGDQAQARHGSALAMNFKDEPLRIEKNAYNAYPDLSSNQQKSPYFNVSHRPSVQDYDMPDFKSKPNNLMSLDASKQ